MKYDCQLVTSLILNISTRVRFEIETYDNKMNMIFVHFRIGIALCKLAGCSEYRTVIVLFEVSKTRVH